MEMPVGICPECVDLALNQMGQHKAAPPWLSPTSSAENSSHRANNSYCAPTSPDGQNKKYVEHVYMPGPSLNVSQIKLPAMDLL